MNEGEHLAWDLVDVEVVLEEEVQLEEVAFGEDCMPQVLVMPVEIDIAEPTPSLNFSTAWTPSCISLARRRLSRQESARERTRGARIGGARIGGARTRGARTRGARTRGARTATYAAFGESEWCEGGPLIQLCVSDANVPPRLKELVDDVHDRNVRREQERRRRVVNDDENANDYDPESEEGLFGGDGNALNFDWSPMDTFQSSQEPFVPETTGPVTNVWNAYDAFRIFWDDTILQHIVVETNRYAAELASRSEAFHREWVDTTVDEIMILFAFWMTLAITPMPTINSCFATEPIFRSDFFRSLFTKNRYWTLNRALHFVDNSTRTPQSSKLFSLGPVIAHLKAAFMNAYMPGQDISIDESLLLWKGNLGFKQYIKTKANQWGIKTFELCESPTGYLWAFDIYTGKDTSTASQSSIPKSTKAVLHLVSPLLNKGHRLFMDNWFNSPILARYLKLNKTDCVGTLRKTRRNVAPLIQSATLPRGHFVARHAGDVMVMAYQDTKPVYMISTCHGVDTVEISGRPGRPSHHKPAVIADYNKCMGGVDKKDQMLEPYLVERKRCMKWSRKLFKRLLNASILNGRILFEQSTDSRINQVTFRIDLIMDIVNIHLYKIPILRQRQASHSNQDLPLGRLVNVGPHFIVRSDVDGARPTTGIRSSTGRHNCTWCLVREKRYRKTVYRCIECNVPLCLNECFQKFHTLG